MAVLTFPLAEFSIQIAPKPARGTFGAQCFHPTCRCKGANWYNTRDRRYYCEQHARQINADCLASDLPRECELHL